MRIIITIDFSPWSPYSGGAQRSSHYLAEALTRRGHNVTVVFTKPPFEAIEAPPGRPYKIRWAVHHTLRSTGRSILRPLNSFSVRRHVRAELADANRRAEPVVVHCNGEEGAQLATLKKDFSFGLVSTPRHPAYPAEFFGGQISRLRLLVLLLTEGKYVMQRKAAREADLCVPPSRFAADVVTAALEVDPDRVRVVHNGVPWEFMSYDYDGRAGATGPIVFFGKFNPNKGADVLVDAYAASGLRDKHELWLIGRGRMADDLMQRAAAHGMEDRIKILDWMTHEELGRVLSTCAAVALPSLEENFSLAVLGSLCVGAPVVSTTVGGTPEMITDRTTGLLVEAGNVEALSRALVTLTTERTFACDLGRRGKQLVRSRFTWDEAAAQFEDLYEDLLREM